MLRSLLQTAKGANLLSIQPCPNCLQRLVPASFSFTPVRTTIIVERVNAVQLHKRSKQPRLKTQHYIYNVTNRKDTYLVKAKVILTKNVRHTGRIGDVLYIGQSLFYRKLFPMGAAVFATDVNMELYDEIIQKRALMTKQSKQTFSETIRAEQTANDLTGIRLPIAMTTRTDTVVTPSHVLVALWKAGIEANESCLTMPEEPVSGQEEFPLSLTVNNTYTATFTGVIYRVSKDSDHLIPRQFDGFLTSKMKKGAEVVTDESTGEKDN